MSDLYGRVRFATFTPEEEALLPEIIERAKRVVFRPNGVKVDVLDVRMDLSAAHVAVPLDFGRLAAFGDGDFAHDVAGIYRHLDRETGELRDCFVPRCARQ